MIILLVVFVALTAFLLIRKRNTENHQISVPKANLEVTSSAFAGGDTIPVEYTGRGADISPDLRLGTLSPDAKSIVVIMDDLDHPIGIYNHWVIWNIPVMEHIPRDISPGAIVSSLGNAVQGIGYGRHRYRGPKPPKFIGTHRYQFNVFVLDSMLDLAANSRKGQVMRAIEQHVVQYGYIVGSFKS